MPKGTTTLEALTEASRLLSDACDLLDSAGELTLAAHVSLPLELIRDRLSGTDVSHH